ncbi:MAG: bioD1 [Deltaproteobacteria bacterium]|nr:bioD1 [Deltaproteobacteria bacterium]
MSRSYFVTGTDTGVGKTFVTAALARRAVELGRKVFAFKPIETGCARVGDQLVGDDQELLSKAAGDWQTGSLRGVYRLALAAAPAVAAEAEGRTIDLRAIDRALSEGKSRADLVLVEGAGGWRVPITSSLDMGGLARRLHMPVLVVARAGLGTINHTLLTLEAAKRDGCVVAAVILSERPEDSPEMARSNSEQIQLQCDRRIVRFRGDHSLDFLL